MGDVKTASDAAAVKVNAKLQAAVAAAAPADAINVMVYAKQGRRSEPLPGQPGGPAVCDAQRHAGLLRPHEGRPGDEDRFAA